MKILNWKQESCLISRSNKNYMNAVMRSVKELVYLNVLCESEICQLMCYMIIISSIWFVDTMCDSETSDFNSLV